MEGNKTNAVNKQTCFGCGTCVNSCPVGAIQFDSNGKAEIDEQKCIKCHTCESVCPVAAIKIKD